MKPVSWVMRSERPMDGGGDVSAHFEKKCKDLARATTQFCEEKSPGFDSRLQNLTAVFVSF